MGARKKSKMNRKQILVTTVTTVLILVIVSLIIFLGVRAAMLNKYENMDIRLPGRFTVTAHTGCMGTEDNSVESMRVGVENGANVIEFDVHFTEDGTPVLSHDEPKGGEESLEVAFDFLARNKTIKANVDMKSTANMEAVRKLADKYGVTKQIFFTGIELEEVDAVKKLGIAYYLNVDVDKSKNTDAQYLEKLVGEVKGAGAIGINFNYKNASSELVTAFHANMLYVSVWTVDGELDMHKALAMAPDNITTRNPDKLNEIIENKS